MGGIKRGKIGGDWTADEYDWRVVGAEEANTGGAVEIFASCWRRRMAAAGRRFRTTVASKSDARGQIDRW